MNHSPESPAQRGFHFPKYLFSSPAKAFPCRGLLLSGFSAGAASLSEELSHMVRGEWKKSALPDRWDGRTAERIIQIL